MYSGSQFGHKSHIQGAGGVGGLLSAADNGVTYTVAYTYDRQGNRTSASVVGVSTSTFDYSLYGQVTNEVQNGTMIARLYDNFGRKKGYSILGDESRTKTRSHEGLVVEYEYDEAGRFKSVSNEEKTFTYNYLEGTDLVSGYGMADFTRTVAYENRRDLIASVSSRFNGDLISSFAYVNDTIGRRTSVQKDGTAFSALQGATDNYGYNYRSEVVSARRVKGDEVIRGFAFDYAYDPIGNRTKSATYDETGAKQEATYTANALNQYTQRTVPGNAQVYGEVLTNATVTVNTNPTYRHGTYFYGGDDANNSASATFKELAIEATTDTLRYAQTGSVFVAKSPEQFTYDTDGNLTSDGRFRYTWNGENRLVRAEELHSPTSRDAYIITYAYDHQGRMVRKDITTTTGTQIKSISYLWDGYNIIRETIWEAEQSASISTKINIWGLDLNGSLQGAGGVGGLLAVADIGATYIPTYDANGNISEYINSVNGAIAAHYDYSPFGEQILASGTLADTFTHRFSTKPFCPYTGLLEYQYRKYHPSLGRWLSRDPIEEEGGVNLYVICENNVVDEYDLRGKTPKDKKFGLPSDFWRWYHRQRKRKGDPDLTKDEAEDFHKEWKDLGEPNPEGKKKKEKEKKVDRCHDGKFVTTDNALQVLINTGLIVAGTAIIILDVVTVPSGEGAVGVVLIKYAVWL